MAFAAVPAANRPSSHPFPYSCLVALGLSQTHRTPQAEMGPQLSPALNTLVASSQAAVTFKATQKLGVRRLCSQTKESAAAQV